VANIHAFVGANGGGKTLAAMAMVVAPALRDGRKVVSTCEIDHPNASVLTSWRELTRLENCVLLLDEISSSLPSRSFSSVPPQLIRMLNQLRKVDVECVWTAPNWARADTVLREVTQRVTLCKGFVPDRYVRDFGVPPWYKPYAPRAIGIDGRPVKRSPRWPSNSLFRYRTYDAQAFEEFSVNVTKTLRPLESHWYWRPWHDDQYLYSTLDSVSLLDHVDDIGVCMGCGGSRKRHICSCDRQAHRAEVTSA